jgi:hypothetical protein
VASCRIRELGVGPFVGGDVFGPLAMPLYATRGCERIQSSTSDSNQTGLNPIFRGAGNRPFLIQSHKVGHVTRTRASTSFLVKNRAGFSGDSCSSDIAPSSEYEERQLRTGLRIMKMAARGRSKERASRWPCSRPNRWPGSDLSGSNCPHIGRRRASRNAASLPDDRGPPSSVHYYRDKHHFAPWPLRWQQSLSRECHDFGVRGPLR